MIELLAESPLLLLFLVAALGYPLGRLRVGGFSLGVAAVLFAGIAFGALDPRLALPELVYLFGLVLFVYTIGLSSGRAFFASFRRTGLRDNALVLAILVGGAALAAALGRALGLGGPRTAGLFAGSLTNTPALAGVLEQLKHGADAAALAEPVVAYSVTYPLGAVGGILAIALFRRLVRVDYAAEARGLRDLGASGEHLVSRTLEVTRPDAASRTLDGWRAAERWSVLFGRHARRGAEVSLALGDLVAQPGDLLSVVGAERDVAQVVAFLGQPSATALELDRSVLDARRVFVSDRDLAGKTLAELALPQRLGAMVTRIRRGDADMIPTGDTRLELGDRVRVVCRRERMEAVTAFFGDSYRALAEIDVMSFGLGVALGLLVGLLPIPLPGGATFRLGFAGGPLVVALVLGARQRTGPVLWLLPYSANLTLRQVGLILFLAGVGTRAGQAFVHTLASGGTGLTLLAAGALITAAASLTALWVGHRLMRIPMSLMIGVLAGLTTQPAVLGYAETETRNDLPSVGYATVFPAATVAKIVLAQVLLGLGG